MHEIEPSLQYYYEVLEVRYDIRPSFLYCILHFAIVNVY